MIRQKSFALGLILALAGGWVVLPQAFYQSRPQPLQFSHRAHGADGAGMACEDCHGFNADGRFAGIPGVGRCAECHAEPIGTTAAEKALVDEYVTPGRPIPWRVYSRQPDNVYFSHVPHVKVARMECADCHGPHGASEQLRPWRVNRVSGYSRDLSARMLNGVSRERAWGLRMDDCCRCHRERGATEACLDCHK